MKLACFDAGRIKGARPRKATMHPDVALLAFVKQFDRSQRTSATEAATTIAKPEAVFAEGSSAPIAGTRVGHDAQRLVKAVIASSQTVLPVNTGIDRRP